MKKVLILGSTGSIGINALNVIRRFADKFRVVGLTVNSNISVLREQIDEFHPDFVVVKDEIKASELAKSRNSGIEILTGESGLIEAAQKTDYDILIGAMVGFAG
ncbi:MAG: 1-deoxy-D-xylulose-5-phosphate reductoisomerase, partial [Endomicrobiia bacterium]